MFNHQHLSDQYFPPVWFAPGDDSHLTDQERKPAGSTSAPRKKQRVIIGDKEYFLTPFETADLLIQRAKKRKQQSEENNSVIDPERIEVIVKSYDKISSDNKKLSKQKVVESKAFDIHAAVNANYAFIARLQDALHKLEIEAMRRMIEEDDEECLMLLL